MKKVIIINGPNLNLLGKRETSIYGNKSFEEYFQELKDIFEGKLELIYFQSNHEGALLDIIHENGFNQVGMVLNAGAYTHTSIALHDAIKGIESPVVEVHISNIEEREAFRHHSFISPVAQKVIMGKGLDGYKEALEFLLEL